MIVSIHQPNFLPWLGFFHKVLCSDVFVLFDDVQFPRGRSYGSRTAIKTAAGKAWLTVPVLSKGERKLYSEIRTPSTSWRRKTLRTIALSYRKAPYFQPCYSLLAEAYQVGGDSLCEFNIGLIQFVFKYLGLSTRVVRSSELGVEETGEEKILSILQELKATKYISGTGEGSRRYVRKEDFQEVSIQLEWQEFAHPVYPQLYGEFVPGLSIVDLLFNCGPQSRAILEGSEE